MGLPCLSSRARASARVEGPAFPSHPLSSKSSANLRAARIGPTVCELDGPTPILKISKMLVFKRVLWRPHYTPAPPQNSSPPGHLTALPAHNPSQNRVVYWTLAETQSNRTFGQAFR